MAGIYLTRGSIKDILNGKDVPNPVIQILSIKKFPNPEANPKKWYLEWKYRLQISDGATKYSYATLGTQINHMIWTNELIKFSIIRVDKYVCNQVQTDRKVIFLMNLTILMDGIMVEHRLGDPTDYRKVSSTSPRPLFTPYRNPTSESWTEPEIGTLSDAEIIKFLNLEKYTMVPSLTAGSINEILNGDDVPEAVLQILGCKTITVEGYNWYRFLISDGITGHPFAILSTDLNHMVVYRKLERFTVIKVKDWSCCEADNKTILLHKLTVLVPGNEVNKMLGNPFNSSTASENGMNGTVHASVSAQS